MRLKIVTPVSDGTRRFKLGEVADVEEGQAKVWLGLGYAEVATQASRKATKRAPRRATKKTAQTRGK